MTRLRTPHTPHWARWQNAVAIVLLFLGIGLYIAQSVSAPLGHKVDFGILPPLLIALGTYVIFGINVLLRLFDAKDMQE